jgi:hypothetical protein
MRSSAPNVILGKVVGVTDRNTIRVLDEGKTLYKMKQSFVAHATGNA